MHESEPETQSDRGRGPSETPPSDWVQIATYFRDSMDKGRAIEMRVAIGAITFDLLLARGVVDALPHTVDRGGLQLLFRLAVIGSLLVLGAMVGQIEYANRRNRHGYHRAESQLERILDAGGGSPEKAAAPSGHGRSGTPPWREAWHISAARSWAGTWPFLAVLLLTILLCLWVGTIS